MIARLEISKPTFKTTFNELLNQNSVPLISQTRLFGFHGVDRPGFLQQVMLSLKESNTICFSNVLTLGLR